MKQWSADFTISLEHCSFDYSNSKSVLRSMTHFCRYIYFRGIHRWPMNSPHKGPVTRKIFPFDKDTMITGQTRARGTYCIIAVFFEKFYPCATVVWKFSPPITRSIVINLMISFSEYYLLNTYQIAERLSNNNCYINSEVERRIHTPYQVLMWTNSELYLIKVLWTKFGEILFTKMISKMWSAKWRPFCLELNAFKHVTVIWA